MEEGSKPINITLSNQDEQIFEKQLVKKAFIDGQFILKLQNIIHQKINFQKIGENFIVRQHAYTQTNEINKKSCLKKESQSFEKMLFSFKGKNNKQLNFNRDEEQIAIPNKQSIYSKFLINGIKQQIQNQQAFNIYEGMIKMADSGEQTSLRVCFNTNHERTDIKMIPKLFQKNVQGEVQSIDYFLKKPITQETKREINTMKQMQMCSYQRFFSGWVESFKKEKQDEVNKIAEKLFEQKEYFEYYKEGFYTVRLFHCEHMFEDFQDITVDHVNYKIITQMSFLIILPQEYYSRFAIVQDCF